MDSLFHPIKFIQKKFYLNAGCSNQPGKIDAGYLERMVALHQSFPKGVRFMLLAFDYHYDKHGKQVRARSPLHIPDEYAWRITQRYPGRFQWIASIHPYRKDCVSALKRAGQRGARAVKWLPPAMGMDPGSPLCDRFYQALVRYDLPLLTHAGTELAVDGSEAQGLGNPLRLRRPLEHGVRVIVAHCASHGHGVDLDKGAHGPRRRNFELFARLMDEPRYEGRLFGEISAMTQINRVGAPLTTVITRQEWHERLINGSDYPLPAVMPLFSMRQLVAQKYLEVEQAKVLSAIRRYNPLLFDFVLKRSLNVDGKRLGSIVFHSRRLFDPGGAKNSKSED
jgi:mannonate dehydratase